MWKTTASQLRFAALVVGGILGWIQICHGEIRFTGVNLAGADFGESNLPGIFNTHYTYPTAGEVDYFVGKGMNTFRLPFRWERLQQAQNAAFSAAELGQVSPAEFPRLTTIFGDNKYHNHQLDTWLKEDRPRAF